jgi:transcriptional regulator with XRE-family HTH domain
MDAGANVESGDAPSPTQIERSSLPTDREHAFMGSDTRQGHGSDASREADWAALVQRIQKRMYLSQLDISTRCRVARQTVSAWLHHRRSPGLYAKRALLTLAAEAGVLDERETAGDGSTARRDDGSNARQLQILLDQLSPGARQEVLEFARFKILRERG